MKGLRFYIFLFAFLVLNLHAASRFTSAEQGTFFTELKDTIDQSVAQNNGKFDLNLISNDVEQFIDDIVVSKKISLDEAKILKAKVEVLKADIKTKSDRFAFESLAQTSFDEINSTSLPKAKINGNCSAGDCGDGLLCVIDSGESNNTCSKASVSCSKNSECCSGLCADDGTGVKVCLQAKKCIQPVSLGGSCKETPYCQEGSCKAFDLGTLGIGECKPSSSLCSNNSDCCSNLCSNGMCIDNFVCLSCADKGEQTSTSKPKCCAGLVKDDNEICVADTPPLVPPEILSGSVSGPSADSIMTDGLQLSTANFAEALKKIGLTLGPKSDFKSCSINFQNDYLSNLVKSGGFDLEIAMLGFDYVMSGNQVVNDYWRLDSSENSSINGRLREIALSHIKEREQTFANFSRINNRLKCLCIDALSESDRSAELVKYFESSCAEYKAGVDNISNLDKGNDRSNAASGIKAKKILVYWAKEMQNALQVLTVKNFQNFQKIAAVREFVAGNKPGPSQFIAKELNSVKSYVVNTYTVKKFSILAFIVMIATLGSKFLMSGGGMATASTAALVIAFNINVSDPLVAPEIIISAKKSSLVAAWKINSPYLRDVVTKKRRCGIRTCIDHTVYLDMPYNSKCNAHISSNACLKYFITTVDANGKPHFVIDPFIPNSLNLVDVVNPAQVPYPTLMENSFNSALAKIKSKKIRETRNVNVEEIGFLAPEFGSQFGAHYLLKDEQVKKILEGARKFAVKYGFYTEKDVSSLNKFAAYVFVYHFIKPREATESGLKDVAELGYEPKMLGLYLAYMSNNVAAKMGVNTANAAMSNLKLLSQYTKNLIDDLNVYKESLGANISKETSTLLNNEISELSHSLTSYNAIAESLGVKAALFEEGKSGLKNPSGANLDKDQSTFVSAISNYQDARKIAIKKLSNYDSKMQEQKDRLAIVKLASAQYGKGLSSPTIYNSAIDSVFASKNKDLLSSLSKVDQQAFKEENRNETSGSNKDTSLTNSYNLNQLMKNTKMGASEKANSVNDSTTGQNKAVEDHPDQVVLDEAIKARNKINSSKFESSEDEGLFKKVTKAYIRNYDKVLKKKKNEVGD